MSFFVPFSFSMIVSYYIQRITASFSSFQLSAVVCAFPLLLECDGCVRIVPWSIRLGIFLPDPMQTRHFGDVPYVVRSIEKCTSSPRPSSHKMSVALEVHSNSSGTKGDHGCVSPANSMCDAIAGPTILWKLRRSEA